MNEKLMKQLKALQKIDDKAVRVAIAQAVAKRASELAPRRTGYLADHIEEKDGNVVSGAPYSEFVEFGTAHMEAQPFLRPAVDEYEQEILQAAADALNAEIRKAVQG